MPEIGVVICSKNTKKCEKRGRIIWLQGECTVIDNLFQNITHEWNEASASNEDQSNQKLKNTEAEKTMQRCTTTSYGDFY